MVNHKEHAELIRKARLGDKASMSRLAEVARVHLREYVLRLTLQEDLTEDIVQETILEMFKVFDKLKKADRFWAWLHGIAFNKIRSHYGKKWRHKTTSLSVVVPAYNEAYTVKESLKRLLVFRECKLLTKVQFIVVDDGSSDKTVEIVENFFNHRHANTTNYEWVFVKHQKNFGKYRKNQN